MKELHFPWMEVSILLPLIGSLIVYLLRRTDLAYRLGVLITGLCVLLTIGESIDFGMLHTFAAHDHWDIFTLLFHRDVFVIDELSAPLLPMAAIVYFVVVLSTLKTQIPRFSLPWTLVSESILLAILSCQTSWVLVLLLVVSVVPPWLELKRRDRCTKVYQLHMAAFVITLLLGWTLHTLGPQSFQKSFIVVSLLSFATLLRSGIVPVHCWMTDLIEKATFGTSILYLTPLTGAYAVMRLVLPIASESIMQSISILSLITAAYAAGMSLVQTETRRFFCFLFLSHASLVLVGVELSTKIGLAGALSIWLSVGFALSGLAITLRSVEGRLGRISLKDFHGLFNQMPVLAGFFLLTGLASIGFPGTIGFIAIEMLIEGAVDVQPLVAAVIVLAVAMNSIAVLMVYFRIFTGRLHHTTVSLQIRPTERLAVLVLAALILIGGLLPQYGVTSRYHAADELRKHRDPSVQLLNSTSAEDTNHAHTE